MIITILPISDNMEGNKDNVFIYLFIFILLFYVKHKHHFLKSSRQNHCDVRLIGKYGNHGISRWDISRCNKYLRSSPYLLFLQFFSATRETMYGNFPREWSRWIISPQLSVIVKSDTLTCEEKTPTDCTNSFNDLRQRNGKANIFKDVCVD